MSMRCVFLILKILIGLIVLKAGKKKQIKIIGNIRVVKQIKSIIILR